MTCPPDGPECARRSPSLTNTRPRGSIDIEKDNDLLARIIATTDRREALRGADYVVSMVWVGGLEAFAHDIEIPLKYGVDQCVGDPDARAGLGDVRRDVRGARSVAATVR
jgi:alpha-galactosidase